MSPMIFGIAVGVIAAIIDVLLMQWGMRKAAENTQKASTVLTATLAVRYLFLAAVLAVALLIGREHINAVWVIVPLIAQKIIWVIISLRTKK